MVIKYWTALLLLLSITTALRVAPEMVLYRNYYHYVKVPKPTALKDVSEVEMSSTDMEHANLAAFNMSIMVYKGSEDAISRTIKEQHGWDTETVQQLCDKWLQAGAKGNILDLGANLGTYTLPLAKYMKEHGRGTSKLIAIEATSNNARKLRVSMRMNALDNVHLYEYAVGLPVSDNSVVFDTQAKNMGHSHMNSLNGIGESMTNEKKHRQVENQDVPLTTLDAITSREGDVMKNVFMVKADIEGSELMAFQGAENFLSHAPCVIYIETLWNKKELYKFFRNRGYSVINEDTKSMASNAWFQRKDLQQCIEQLQ